MTVIVPKAVIRSVDAAMLRASGRDVYGVLIAAELTTGFAELETLQRMDQFFHENHARYYATIQQLKTIDEDDLILSWKLHGSTRAAAWVKREVGKAVAAGLLEADPVLELYSKGLADLYGSLSLGAWRYVYGFNPMKAAKFVETYTRATGNHVDLSAAFGEGAYAVGKSLYRRYHSPNPYRVMARLETVGDASDKLSVSLDCEELDGVADWFAQDYIVEKFGNAVYSSKSLAVSNLLWPAFVAYFILTIESPRLLNGLTKEMKKLPRGGFEATQKINYMQYADAVATLHAFTNQNGAKFDTEVYISVMTLHAFDYLNKYLAFFSHGIHPKKGSKTLTIKKLRVLHKWVNEQGKAGPIFNTVLRLWGRKDWKSILALIPKDADVYEPFKVFAGGGVTTTKKSVGTGNVPVKGSVEDIKVKEVVADSTTDLTVIGLDQTPVAGQLKIGTWLLDTATNDRRKVIGAVMERGNSDNKQIILISAHGGNPVACKVDKIVNWIADGTWKIVGEKTASGDSATGAKSGTTTVSDPIEQYMKGEFGSVYAMMDAKPAKISITNVAVYSQFEEGLVEGLKLKNKNSGIVYEYARAYDTPRGVLLVFYTSEGEYIWFDDEEVYDAVLASKLELIGWVKQDKEEVTLPDPKYTSGTVLELKPNDKRVVFGFDVVNDMYRLSQNMIVGSRTSVMVFSDPTYRILRTELESTVLTFESLNESVKVAMQNSFRVVGVIEGVVDFNPHVKVGDTIKKGFSGEFTYLMTAKDITDGKVVVISLVNRFDIYGDNVYTILARNADAFKIEASSYAPSDVKPENSKNDSGLEAPVVGTADAIYIVDGNEGMRMVPQYNTDYQFKFQIGTTLTKSTATWTVNGYIFDDKDGRYKYVLFSSGGVPTIFTTPKQDYKGYEIGFDSEVNKAAIAIEASTVEADPYAHLNYAVSGKLAEYIAQGDSVTLVNAPEDKEFVVGTTIKRDSGEDVIISGYTEIEGSLYVLQHGSETGEMYVTTYTSTQGATVQVTYQNKTSVSDNSVTFGKGVGDTEVEVTHEKLLLPSPAPADYMNPEPVVEPLFSNVPAGGKHISAGIIAVLPAGIAMGGKVLATMSMVFVHPMNQFGGYKLTIPKGTIEKGESTIKAAVREFHEETGLSCKPVAYLGDYTATTSYNRIYIGYVTGGNPVKAGNETDAVTFRGVSSALGLTTKTVQELTPSSGGLWQVVAVKAALKWIDKNEHPMNYTVEPEAQEMQVATSEDLDKATDASMVMAPSKADIFKGLISNLPYKIPMAAIDALKLVVTKFGGELPISYTADKEGGNFVHYGERYRDLDAIKEVFCGGFITLKYPENSKFEKMRGGTQWYLMFYFDLGSGDWHMSNGESKVVEKRYELYEFPKKSSPYIGGLQQLEVSTLEHIAEAGFEDAEFKVLLANSEFTAGALKFVKVQDYADIVKLFKAGSNIGELQLIQKYFESLVANPDAYQVDVEAGELKHTQTFAISKGSAFDSVTTKHYLLNANADDFKASGGSLSGSSKPTAILTGPNGTQWAHKWGYGEKDSKLRAEAEMAAYLLTSKLKSNAVPIGVLEFDANYGSLQPLLPAVTAVDPDPTRLTPKDMAEVLRQHAVDMFMGDHDGHANNWIRSDGRLVPVDRGQAFKFIVTGQPESLDPNWHAPGNFGKGFAKGLLIEWSKGKVEIERSVWKSFHETIEKVSRISNTVLREALQGFTDAVGSEGSKVVKKLIARRKTYLDDWTTVLQNLRTDFTWPVGLSDDEYINPVIDYSKITTTPDAMGFDEAAKDVIDNDVFEAGLLGKSVSIDSDSVEDQNVMVKSVVLLSNSVKSSEGTLLSWRVNMRAGIKATNSLKQFVNPADIVSDSLNETSIAPLPFDSVKKGAKFYGLILEAAGNINYHMGKGQDAAIKWKYFAPLKWLRDELNEMKQYANSEKSDSILIHGLHVGRVDVIVMGKRYVRYIDELLMIANEVLGNPDVNGVATTKPKGKESIYIGTLLEYIVYTAQEPSKVKPEQIKKQKASAFTVRYRKGAAKGKGFMPARYSQAIDEDKEKGTKTRLAMRAGNMRRTQYDAGGERQPQFIITGRKRGGPIIYFNPPIDPFSTTSGRLESQTHHGQCWATIVGKTTAQKVAEVMKLFEVVTAIPMKGARQEDQEALFWSKQAYAAQSFDGGWVNPELGDEKVDGVTLVGSGVVDTNFKNALEVYRGGDVVNAVKLLKQYVAVSRGVSIETIESQAEEVEGGFNGVYDNADGSGFKRQLRIGWNVAKLEEAFGKEVHIGHKVTGIYAMEAFMRTVLPRGGALIANAVRPTYGIEMTGSSLADDFKGGGSQSSFGVLVREFPAHGVALYFDISLLLRNDVLIVGSYDAFGKVSAKRLTSIEAILHNVDDAVRSTSWSVSVGYQVNMRSDVDLLKYLYMATCAGNSDRDETRQYVSDFLGASTKFARGRSIEQVFVTGVY